MVRNEYGKTTWGEAFLDALGRLDTNARLGRGKTYANTGKVLTIGVKGPQVTAKVQGNYGVYDVLVQFQVFAEKEKQEIYAIIDQNPILLAHILNGELPDELLNALFAAHIKLFPTSWRAIRARCSCPDDGNPCKHMAAVYFLLTSEIDKNPFTLFLLRDVDLKRHFNVKNNEIEPSYPLPATEIKETTNSEKETVVHCELVKIPHLANFILDCLSPNPAFSMQLDYKDVMMEFYRFAEKKGKQVIGSFPEGDPFDSADGDTFQRVWSNSCFQLKLSENFSNAMVLVKNEVFNSDFDIKNLMKTIPNSVMLNRLGERIDKVISLDLFTAFQVFLRCTSDFGTRSYRYFYYAFRVALLLINSQAYIPDVLPMSYSSDNGKVLLFKIIWKPLYSCSIILEQLKNLNDIFPLKNENFSGGSILLEVAGKSSVRPKKSLDASSGTLHLLTALLTQLVRKMEFSHKKLKNNPPKESLTFFFGQVFHVMSLAEHNIPKAITKYFGVFELMKTDFKVSIQITNNTSILHVGSPPTLNPRDDKFNIGLLLTKSGSLASDALSLRRFLQRYPTDRNQILKFLSTLSPYLNNVEKFLLKDDIPLSSGDLEVLLLQTAKLFANLGVQVILPRELKNILKPRAVVRTRSKSVLDENMSQKSFLSLNQLLCYNWMICIGNEQITVEEFQKMVRSGKKLFKFKETYVAITAEEMKNILSSVNKQPPTLSGIDLLKERLRENSMFMLDSEVEEFFKKKLKVTDHMVPATLNCTLRGYQTKGFRWLVSNLLNGFGCILADDMGLGKTIQMIAAIAYLKSQGILKNTVLIVVPSSLVSNWNREIHRFAPTMTVSTYYGAGRQIEMKDQQNANELVEVIKSITSPLEERKCDDIKQKSIVKYEMETDIKDDIKTEVKHEVKTEQNATSIAPFLFYKVKTNTCDQKTVVKSEMKTEGPSLPPVKAETLDQRPATVGSDLYSATKAERKRPFTPDSHSKPASTKRVKRKANTEASDVILTTYSLIWRDLSELQKKNFGLICIDEAQYIKNSKSQTTQALKKLKAPLRVALSGTPVENNLAELWSVFDFVLPKYLGNLKDFKASYSKPIEVNCDEEKLIDLKAVSSPFLLRRLKTDKNVIKDLPSKIVDNKYTTLVAQQAALYEGVVQDITQKISESQGIQRKGLIFKLLTSLKQICNHPANFGDDTDLSPEKSGKTKLLFELLEPIIKAGEKCLIFTQYVKMIHILQKIIEKKLSVKPLIFEGSMPQKKRDCVVNEFQNHPYRQIFLISLKAGGVGLNLTAANHVIHYDLWYNPAVENQATDRAFRIGQTKNVFVHRLITQNTFEEKIDEMLKQKQSLSDMSISVQESWITELSNEDLKKLFMRTP
ncbi:uncharacterized protein LOC114529246 [Dendronephthya gigantea]|uniref:uncharacterized protein LOC114529246 n=1 Tax=Dendronephthya gigantea TaxID=151771 RepID=UPI001069895B|nr:uncharacterized protein LOC114529246 [Dendronephthya gigantea]